MSAESALPLVYLSSRYPAISHAFILREIRELRQLGLRIHAISINPPDRPAAQLTAEEHDEALSTFYVKSAGLRGILLPHLWTLVGRPLAYFRGVLFALRLGGADLRKLVFGLFYLAEAVTRPISPACPFCNPRSHGGPDCQPHLSAHLLDDSARA
jgi:hypothetical protein